MLGQMDPTSGWTGRVFGHRTGLHDRFNQLRLEAKAGRTAQGLVVEKLFLAKHRADKGIQARTFEEERAHRRGRGGGGRAVAVAPAMDAAAV